MSLELKEKKITQHVAGIPGMNGVYPFIFSERYFLASNSVVLHIVNEFQ
jgi:hypothetical protein